VPGKKRKKQIKFF